MKKMYSICFAILISFAFQSAATAQSSHATSVVKKYINNTVQKVEQETDVMQKRVILNKSFDRMTRAFDQIADQNISENDAEAIMMLKANIVDKRNELNGQDGFIRVENSNLNNFAQFVQDDFEQASDTFVVGLSTVLLIVIILLLL